MQMRAWVLACAIAVSCVVLLPTPAAAQRLVSIVPFTFGSITMNSSAQHIVNDTSERLVPDDTDGLLDLYVHTVATGTLRRLPRLQLVGAPEAAATAQFEVLSISDDGRFLAYVTRRYGNDHRQLPPVLARYDLQTGARVVVRDAAVDVFVNPTMSRDGSSFAWIGANGAVHVATVGQTPLVVGAACATSDDCASRPALTADGSRVLYLVMDASSTVARLETFDRSTGARALYPEAAAQSSWNLATDAGGHYAAISGVGNASRFIDLTTRRVEQLPVIPTAISTDGRYLLAFNGVYDRRSSLVLSPGGDGSVAMSADGRQVLVRFPTQHLLLDLDGDNDGMWDPWETIFGLSHTNSADGAGDDDGDGISNRAEFERGSHPRGYYRRVFAEGITTREFRTDVFVTRRPQIPATFPPLAPIVVSFLGDDGSRGTRALDGRPYPQDGGVATVPGTVTSAAYAIVVESEGPVVAERVTTWGAAEVRGAHATAGSLPATEWYLAEGATIGGLQLFYLLANQEAVATTVNVEYMLATGQRVMRQYVVPPESRRTIWVNREGEGLDAAEVSAHVVASGPIVVERAMYLTDASGAFSGGSASAGVSAPATTWRFAEGATGPVFDAFLALFNPTDTVANVQLTFRLPDGRAVQSARAVPPRSRRTVWVDQEDPLLADTAFSTLLQADVPIVAERAMWWRAAGATAWTEGHAEVGATTTSPFWMVADMLDSAFLLISNESPRPGRVRVTLYTPSGGGAASATYDMPASSRTTSWPRQDMSSVPAGRYLAVVESLQRDGQPRVDLVVERAGYSAGLRAGTVFLATPFPDVAEPPFP